MNKRLTCAILLAWSAIVCHADPYVGYIYPSGIQAGTTNRFIVGGQGLFGVQGFYFSGKGLHVLSIEKVPNFSPPTGMQRRHLVKWLDGIAAGDRNEPPLPNDPHLNEWRSNAWWSVLGTLDPQKLAIVERDLHVPKNALQATPSLRQMLLVTVAADADAPLGRSSFVGWGWNGISAPRYFEVTAAPHIHEPMYVPPHRMQPEPPVADVRTNTAVMLDGQIMPGSTDAFLLHLPGGRRTAFTVAARELQPFIGDAVPGFFNAVITLKDTQGNTVAVADDEARFRPDPVLEYVPPKDGLYRLEIHDVLYRGRADFVYSIAVGEARPRGKTTADGVVARPGATATRKFKIDTPGPRILEVTARRRGSPLDAVLTLRRTENGPILAQWDDVTNKLFTGTVPQSECDPIGFYDFTEPGEYLAEISDRTRHGGGSYVWWLDIRDPRPDFEVFSSRSTLSMTGGKPANVTFRILRKDGFNGDVKLEFPQNLRVRNGVLTSAVDEVRTSLFYTGTRPAGIQPVKIFASATIGGTTVRHPVVPCDEYEQAFAWKHLVPAESFLMRCQPAPKKPSKQKTSRPAR